MMADDFTSTGAPFSGEPGTGAQAEPTAGPETASGGERVAFCQNCGRPLSRETVRTVGSGVFCEPCLEQRVNMGGTGAPGSFGTAAAGGGWAQVPPAPGTSAGRAPGAMPSSPLPVSDEPAPGLAALLGLIPGVGAMYNGQFAKGVAHLAIFALLVSLSNNVNGIFGLFVAGWIFYQSFEAYHTAKARRDGLPLPDPFGLNDIGDRFNFNPGRTSPAAGFRGTPPVPPVPPAGGDFQSAEAPGGWNAPQGTVSPTAGAARPPEYSQPSVAASWLGYVPPQSFAGSPPPTSPFRQPGSPAQPPFAAGAPYSPVAPAYGETFAAGAASFDPLAEPPVRRLPLGAFWLIGLGVLVLLFNVVPGWHLSPGWLSAALLAGIAAFSFSRRITAWGSRWSGDLSQVPAGQWVHAARFPALLLTIAILLAFQAAHWLTLGQTWPLLLVVIGALLLLERLLPVLPEAAAFPAPTTPTGYVSGSAMPASRATPVGGAETPTSSDNPQNRGGFHE